MTNRDSKLEFLATISESSIGGFFQELLSKKASTPELKLGDVEGSDFKRLMNKKKYKRISTVNEDTLVIETSSHQQQQQQQQQRQPATNKKYHVNSPDFRPVVYLSNNSDNNSSNTGLFSGNRFFSLFSPRKDRYFNNDREELSKDIFPVGHQP